MNDNCEWQYGGRQGTPLFTDVVFVIGICNGMKQKNACQFKNQCTSGWLITSQWLILVSLLINYMPPYVILVTVFWSHVGWAYLLCGTLNSLLYVDVLECACHTAKDVIKIVLWPGKLTWINWQRAFYKQGIRTASCQCWFRRTRKLR